uniref:Uncharacterized protein n=1 Tax=Romanomermis culicivorax TaxID=13658 RepID=A0A915KIL7_ROMCU
MATARLIEFVFVAKKQSTTRKRPNYPRRFFRTKPAKTEYPIQFSATFSVFINAMIYMISR